MKKIIVGLGNPLLKDDSIGIRIIKILKERIRNKEIKIIEAYSGGLMLLDILEGYDKAVIVDSMITGKYKWGTIKEVCLEDINKTKNLTSTHDTSLYNALELGKMLGLKIPEIIRIYGIEAKDVYNFGDDLTEELQSAVVSNADFIIKNIKGDLL